jgi:EAL domain-containing protein (putative c-di-GMP-specific phosphodiesterase class I)
MYRPFEGRREMVSARFAEVERIRHALEEDRLLLYGQPILDLATNQVSSYELLLRRPDNGAASRSRRAPFSTRPSARA